MLNKQSNQNEIKSDEKTKLNTPFQKKETNSNNCDWKWCEGLGFVLIITGFVYFYLFVGYGLKATDKWRKAVVLKAANAGKILQHGVGLYFVNFEIAKFLFYYFVTDVALFLSFGRLQFYISAVMPITYFFAMTVTIFCCCAMVYPSKS